MSRCFEAALAAILSLGACVATAADRYPGVGRPATPAEVRAWDIDVRPDFTGLPKGAGTVERGMTVWEAQCASCHGVFGESNEVFTPIVGGTTADDIASGRVHALVSGASPQRTTMMKVATVSTLFDYIQRAMPWTSPKSLSPDDVYAVLAYLLNLAEIVPADFELNERNIGEVQARMPNRNGMRTDHGLWPGAAAAQGGMGNGGKPDTKSVACMTNCKPAPQVVSMLPAYAQDAHGNLAEQNRSIGQTRGKPTVAAGGVAPAAGGNGPLALAQARGCMACHGVASKLVGPAYDDIAAKYRAQADAEARLLSKLKTGGQGVWGTVAMPPQAHVQDDELRQLVRWILAGAQAR